MKVYVIICLRGGKPIYLEEIVRKCHGSEQLAYQQVQEPLQLQAWEQWYLCQRMLQREMEISCDDSKKQEIL